MATAPSNSSSSTVADTRNPSTMDPEKLPQTQLEDAHMPPLQRRRSSMAEDDEKVSSNPPFTPPTFPEGGARAWLVAAGAACAMFCTFGYLNAFGVYQAYYAATILKNHTESQIAWIGSIQICFLFGAGLFAGSIFDRWGAPVVVIPASIGLVISVMMTSLCTEYYQFILAQGILGGICCGSLFTPCVSAVNHYFNKKRGAAMGLVIAGSSLGGVIFPIMLDKLLRRPSIGFGWTVRIIGFMFLGLLSFTCAVTKGRLPPRKGAFFLPKAFKQPAYSILVVGVFITMWGLFTPFFFIPGYAQAHGVSESMSVYLVAILNATSIFGRILPGIMADRLGRMNLLTTVCFSTCIIIWCWLRVHSTAGYIVFSAFFGFTSGGVVSLFPACFGQLTPNPSEMGTYMGQAMSIMAIAGLTGSPISGQLVTSHGWNAAVYWAGISTLIGSCIIITSKLVHNRDITAIV